MSRTKHFVTVNGRRLHYRRSGQGPAVALFHSAAMSLKAFDLVEEVFSAGFTVFNFDIPGFGLSELLPQARPEIADYADFFAHAFDVMRIEMVATYGRHFGGAIAVEFARRHPHRCAMALTDGFPVFTQKRDESYLSRYLPPIVPVWDGSHMTWLWYRCREQHVFWPWNNQKDETRSAADAPSPKGLHRAVVELLEAGSDYRIGYSAAFRHAGLDIIPDLKVPVCFGNRPGDSQHWTMKLYPPDAWIEEMPREAYEAAKAELQLLRRHPAEGRLSDPVPCISIEGKSTPGYLDIHGQQIFYRMVKRDGNEWPLLILHALPGTSALYDDLVLEAGKRRTSIALDLPGHGESDASRGSSQSIKDHAAAVVQFLDKLGIRQVHLYAHSTGGAVALEVKRVSPERVGAVVLDAPPCFSPEQREVFAASYAVDIDPSPEGSHLVRLWHHLRDQELWWPWFEKRHTAARQTARIDPDRLLVLTRELAKQPQSYAASYREALRYPFCERISDLLESVTLIGADDDIFWPTLRAAALDAVIVEDNARSRATALLSAIESS